MQYAAGEILTPNGFIKGYLSFDERGVQEFGQGNPPAKSIAKGLIVPSLVNAHTHIGDTFVRRRGIELPKDIEALVAPPNGLKHLLLREASNQEVIDGMEQSLEEMIRCGTGYFCDFRESGIAGANRLKQAMRNKSIQCVLLSRPESMAYDKREIDILLEHSHGLGLSSISDWDYSILQKIAKQVNRKHKLFGLHASEAFRENIDSILDLHPDFLIHMTHATKDDFSRVFDANIPIIICPRSTVFFHQKPPIGTMKASGVTLLLGSDNAMLHPPNIIEEVKVLNQLFPSFSLEELLLMITYTPRKALNLDDHIQGPNSLNNFVVLERETLQPLYISKYHKRGMI